MCKAKPGRRCPKCRGAAVTAQRSALARAQARYAAATNKSAADRDALGSEVRSSARELIMRQTELDSTDEVRAQLESEINRRVEADPKDPELAKLSKRLIEGRLMDEYRREQVAAMPARPTHPAAVEAYRELGDARYDMARAKVRMDINGDNPAEWNHWSREHFKCAEAANTAAARMHVIEAAQDGRAWQALSNGDRIAVRQELAEGGSFTTPAAPRPIDEILHDYADRSEGYEPLPDPLDYAAHAPFAGFIGPVRKPPITQTATKGPATEETATKRTAEETAPKRTANKRTATEQKRRRSERSRDARRMLASIRSTSGKINPDRLATKAGVNPSGGSGQHADSLDCTGMLLLLELLPTK
jgi:hypothetical protein